MELRATFLGLLAFLFTACSSGNTFENIRPPPISTEIPRSAATPAPIPISTSTPTPVSTSVPIFSPSPEIVTRTLTPNIVATYQINTPNVTPTLTPTSIPTPAQVIMPTQSFIPSITSIPTISPQTTPISSTIRMPSPAATSHPTPTRTSVPSPTRTPANNKKRIVFVAGLCSSDPKDTFEEIGDWLVQNKKFDNSNFVYFNYDDINSEKPYSATSTLKWIRGEGGSAQNLRNFLVKQHKAYPDSKFALITYSLGGIVALYVVEHYPELNNIISSVLTIESPVHGIDLTKAAIREFFPCVSDEIIERYKTERRLVNPSVLPDLLEGSPVIDAIEQTKYSNKGVNVVMIANSDDPVLFSTKYPDGKLGILSGERDYIYPFGHNPYKTPSERGVELARTLIRQHGLPLLIETLEKSGREDAVEYIREALIDAVED